MPDGVDRDYVILQRAGSCYLAATSAMALLMRSILWIISQ